MGKPWEKYAPAQPPAPGPAPAPQAKVVAGPWAKYGGSAAPDVAEPSFAEKQFERMYGRALDTAPQATTSPARSTVAQATPGAPLPKSTGLETLGVNGRSIQDEGREALQRGITKLGVKEGDRPNAYSENPDILGGLGDLLKSANYSIRDWWKNSSDKDKENLIASIPIEATGTGAIARLSDHIGQKTGNDFLVDKTGNFKTDASYDPVAELEMYALNAGSWSTRNQLGGVINPRAVTRSTVGPQLPGVRQALAAPMLKEVLPHAADVATNMTMGGSDVAAAAARGGVNLAKDVGNALRAGPAATPQPAPVTAAAANPSVAQAAPAAVPPTQPRPASTGQQPNAGNTAPGGAAPAAQPVLNATPVATAPRTSSALAKSDAKDLARMMRFAGVPRNDVMPLLADLVHQFNLSNDPRLRLKFFAAEYLPQKLPKPVADAVLKQFDAFGFQQLTEPGPGAGVMTSSIDDIRGTQKAYLEGEFDKAFGKEDIVTKTGKLKKLKSDNAEAIYRKQIADQQGKIDNAAATPEQMAARDNLLLTMGRDDFFKKLPAELDFAAKNEGFGSLWEYVHQKPLEAAHWMQSKLGFLERGGSDSAGLYGQMRKMILNDLEEAVPGYRGARMTHGDAIGQELAKTLGNELRAAAGDRIKVADLAKRVAALPNSQKSVARLSVKEMLKNEFRKVKASSEIDPATGNPVDAQTILLTQLQKDGMLDALETVFPGKKRGRVATDAIRKMMRENDGLPSYRSDTAPNQKKQSIEALRSPANKLMRGVSEKTGYAFTIPADLVASAVGAPPVFTASKVASDIGSWASRPNPKRTARTAQTLYGTPPANANALAPASPRRLPPPRRPGGSGGSGGPQALPPTQQTLDDLLAQYDAVDPGKEPAKAERIRNQIRKVQKQLAKLPNALASPSTPPVRNGSGPINKAGFGGSVTSQVAPPAFAATVASVGPEGEAPEDKWARMAAAAALTVGVRNLPALRNFASKARGAGGANQATFGGINAKTADLKLKGIAEQMEKAGAGRDQIWKETGWFKGNDGKWRFEIDDSGANLTGKPQNPDGQMYDAASQEMFGVQYGRLPFGPDSADGRSTLGPQREAVIARVKSQIDPRAGALDGQMEHPSLYEAYPEARDTEIYLGDKRGPANASWDGQRISTDSRDDLSAVLHENQHATQQREGFAMGGSTENSDQWTPEFAAWAAARNNLPEDQVDALRKRIPQPYEAYKRLAGEVEARNVEARRDFTPEERRARPPWTTQDVPDDQQIVRYGSGEARSEPTPTRAITIATGKTDNGKGYTVTAEAYNDRGRMVLSPEWPSNALATPPRPPVKNGFGSSSLDMSEAARLPQQGYEAISVGPATVGITRVGNAATINSLKVPEAARGNGAASRALDAVLRQADAEGVTVFLTPERIGDSGLSDAQLKAFYTRHGFATNRGPDRDFSTQATMVRAPRPSQSGSSKLLAGVGGRVGSQVAPPAFAATVASVGPEGEPAEDKWARMAAAAALTVGVRNLPALRQFASEARGTNQATFGGVNAKTADLKLQRIAEQMEKAGAGRDQIWKETGWFKGNDGAWKFEIPDNDLQVRPDAALRGKGVLNDFVSDADAGGAYPELAAIPTKRGEGYYQPPEQFADEEISFSGRGQNARSVIAHERQHAIQDMEGFATGESNSPTKFAFDAPYQAKWDAIVKEKREIMNAVDIGDLRKRQAKGERISPNELPYLERFNELEAQQQPMMRDLLLSPEDTYRRSAGEVEARNVQKRLDMTPEERRRTPPWVTQDTPDDKQVISIQRGGGRKSAPPAQAGFSFGVGGKRPPNALKDPGMPGPISPRVLEDATKAAGRLSPEVRNKLRGNAFSDDPAPAMQASGFDPNLFSFAQDARTPPPGKVQNAFARLTGQPTANPLERGLQKSIESVAGQRGRSALRVGNEDVPDLPFGMRMAMGERNATRKEQALARRAYTRAEKADKLDADKVKRVVVAEREARVAQEILDQARLDAFNAEDVGAIVREQMDAIAKAMNREPPSTLGLPTKGQRVSDALDDVVFGAPPKGARARPKAKDTTYSASEADDAAKLLFSKEYARVWDDIVSGRTPVESIKPGSKEHMVLTVAAVGGIGALGVTSAMLADRTGPMQEPHYPKPEDPRVHFDWTKQRTNRRFVENLQTRFNQIDRRYQLREDGIWAEGGDTDKVIRFWQDTNGFAPDGNLTEDQAALIEEQAIEALRAEPVGGRSGQPKRPARRNALAPAQ